MLKYPSRIAWIVSAAFILLTAFWYYPKWQKPGTEATLSWDVSGYYMYLPAIVVHHDLKEHAFRDEVIQRYQPSPVYDQAYKPPGSSNYVMKYSAGQAVQYLPFFLIAHALAPVFGYPADGFSPPYQLAIQLGSVLVALLGLWLVRRALRPRFGEWPTALTLLVIVLGTNYLNYAAIDGAMTHNWLFTAYAGLLLLTVAFYHRPTVGRALAIGAVIGLMTLTRPTDILAVLLPALWGLMPTWAALRARGTFWQQHKGKLLAAAVAAAALISVQPLYWHYATGDWIVYSYQDQGFSWLHPHLWDGIFSFRSGWLLYSPLLVTALLGFGPLRHQQPGAFWAMLLYTLLVIYVTFAWDIWWYGGSLGQRAMVQSYAVLAWPMAAAIRWLLARPRWAVAWGVVAVLGCYYNLWLTHQAHRGGLLVPGTANRAYFMRVLGRYEVPIEAQLLLDSNNEYTGTPEARDVLWTQDFEQAEATTCGSEALAGHCSLVLDEHHQRSPEYVVPVKADQYDWIRASVVARCSWKEWDESKMTQYIVRFRRGTTIVKERLIRLQRALDDGWAVPTKLHIDVYAPERVECDNVVVTLYNPGSKPIIVDDLTVEGIKD